ncbi:SOS response-associated peptidase [Jannaschia sp. R86511]|uniref:SOS response-associated peptidase n=1 Tax=Jannaschia sp. R86511 TaxID=3093853 RepID=UPI0036D3470C
MCGRYAASRRPEDLVEEVEASGLPVSAPSEADREALAPRWNVAPTQPVAAVMAPRPDDGSGSGGGSGSGSGSGSGGDGQAATGAPPARLRAMRWGLVPSWAKDPTVGNRMINARVETVTEKPAFRRLVGSRRCLLPADGWYEWQVVPAERSGTGKARKQPFFMSPLDGGLTGLAGLYSWWRDREVADDDDPAAWLGTVTVLTTAAEPGLRAVHDRMPVVLPAEHWAAWVDRDVPAADALAVVAELPQGRFGAVPVQAAVGNVRNDSPALLARPDADALVGVVDPATGQLLG